MNPIDIDRPSTWTKFVSPKMCDGCFAGCCTLPLEVSVMDLIRLGLATEDEAAVSLKKIYKRLHAAGVVRSFFAKTQVFILEQKTNRDCRYLDSLTRRCTVYARRPTVCRQFPKIGPRPGFCPRKENALVKKI